LARIYRTRGYGEDKINELIDLRMRLEYFAMEEIEWPVSYLNPQYDPSLREYLERIRDDVIVPDEDVPWLRQRLLRSGA